MVARGRRRRRTETAFGGSRPGAPQEVTASWGVAFRGAFGSVLEASRGSYWHRRAQAGKPDLHRDRGWGDHREADPHGAGFRRALELAPRNARVLRMVDAMSTNQRRTEGDRPHPPFSGPGPIESDCLPQYRDRAPRRGSIRGGGGGMAEGAGARAAECRHTCPSLDDPLRPGAPRRGVGGGDAGDG